MTWNYKNLIQYSSKAIIYRSFPKKWPKHVKNYDLKSFRILSCFSIRVNGNQLFLRVLRLLSCGTRTPWWIYYKLTKLLHNYNRESAAYVFNFFFHINWKKRLKNLFFFFYKKKIDKTRISSSIKSYSKNIVSFDSNII